LPPLHSFCRCTTVAEFDDDTMEGLQRRAKDENGKYILVPQDMTYQEWYNKYVDKEEGILNDLFNKNTKLKDITTQREKIIEETFKNEKIKNIALNANIKSIKAGGNKAYHRRGNIVLKEDYTNRTIIHEIGHVVDYNNKWLSSNKNFMKAINTDKEYVLTNKDIYKTLIQENKSYKELSDIISGMTKNKIRGRYYHKTRYWNKPNKLEKEIFAQMFTMAGKNDIKQLKIFERYFPNTFKEFGNIIRRLL